MSSAYTADGRRRSSMTHAKRGHECDICGRTVFGNGGQVSHGRGHVRRGEAVELVRYYDWNTTGRFFFSPDDPHVAAFEAKGYEKVVAP